MKKILAITALFLTITCSFVGCGERSGDNTSNDGAYSRDENGMSSELHEDATKVKDRVEGAIDGAGSAVEDIADGAESAVHDIIDGVTGTSTDRGSR